MQTLECFQLYPELYNPWWHSRTWYISCAIFLTLLSIVIIYYAYRCWSYYYYRFDKVFLRFLVGLRADTFTNQGSIRAVYFKLTEALKKYLEARYQVVLKDKNDQELVDFLHSNLPVKVVSLLQDFLNRAFLVKFARHEVDQHQLQSDLVMLIQLVHDTMQK